MSMHGCPHGGSLCRDSPDQQQVPRLYGPTIDGFERFRHEIRHEMVQVPTGPTAGGQDGTGGTQLRRNSA
jgi:hypothetical protein